MTSTKRSFLASLFNGSVRGATRRPTFLHAVALITAVGVSGCAVSADDNEEMTDEQEEAIATGALSEAAFKMAGPIGAAAGVVSAAVSVAKFLGFGGAEYANLSDATIGQIAKAVGQTVDTSLLQKDSADASALLFQVGSYTRANCTNCSADLQTAKLYAHDYVVDSSKLLFRMTDSNIGNKQLQVAQHIQAMGTTLVLFQQEAYTIQKLLGTSASTLPTLRKNICDSAELVHGRLNKLETRYDTYIQSLFTPISVTSSGIKHVGKAKACFKGPFGEVCKEKSWNGYDGNVTSARASVLSSATTERNSQIKLKTSQDRPKVLGGSFDKTRAKIKSAADAC